MCCGLRVRLPRGPTRIPVVVFVVVEVRASAYVAHAGLHDVFNLFVTTWAVVKCAPTTRWSCVSALFVLVLYGMGSPLGAHRFTW